ncbi:MAG: sigma-E processing peptidase SpoIIGA [Bacilli bacterium]|nr:sigma-E processing peptidase SpoIIGA [Bacilli bacterium]
MVYIDLLIIQNLILNYCIIIGTSILLNRITKIKKIFLSSVIGCIPLIFIFININKITIFLISLVFSIIMSIISFKYKDILYTVKNVIYMYFISIFIAGTIYLININFLPKIDNHILNFIVLIILSPIITYYYTKSIIKIKSNYSNYYKIDIYLKDNTKVTLNSYLDTGNILKDPYKNRPIILINKDKINYQKEKIILVPYNTIDNHSLLKCFKPEKIYIERIGYKKKVLIGLIDEVGIEGAECIMNKYLLERI